MINNLKKFYFSPVILAGVLGISIYVFYIESISAQDTPAKDKKYFVNADNGLPLRDKPSFDSKVLTVMPKNAAVELLDQNGPAAIWKDIHGKWYQVRYADLTGYAFSPFIISIEDHRLLESREETKRIYFVESPSGLKLHEQPDSNAPVITLVPHRTQVFSLEEARSERIDGILGTWHKVYLNNLVGWMFNGFLTDKLPPRLCTSLKAFPIFIGLLAGPNFYPVSFTLYENGKGIFYIFSASRAGSSSMPINWKYKNEQIVARAENLTSKSWSFKLVSAGKAEVLGYGNEPRSFDCHFQ